MIPWTWVAIISISISINNRLLTAEVEVDGGGDLAKLVLGAHLVQPRVALDHIVDLEHHEEAPVGRQVLN